MIFCIQTLYRWATCLTFARESIVDSFQLHLLLTWNFTHWWRNMAHHFKLVFLLSFNRVLVFKYKSQINTWRMRHEQQPIVSSYSCCHTKTLEVDCLKVDCIHFCTLKHFKQASFPHEIILLVGWTAQFRDSFFRCFTCSWLIFFANCYTAHRRLDFLVLLL